MADQQLDKVYAMAMKQQNQGGKAKPRNSQRACIKQCDAKYQEKDSPEDYTDPADVYLCLADETRKRALQLEKHLYRSII